MAIDSEIKILIRNACTEGLKPKQIIKKLGLSDVTPKQISDLIYKQKWKCDKENITTKVIEKAVEKVSTKIEKTYDKIELLTNKSLNVLENVLDDDDAKISDKIAAAKAIIDISGLKVQKNVVTTDSDIKKAQKEIERVLFG